MLQILHKGLQVSLDLDTSGFTGDPATDAASLSTFVGGKLIAVGAAGATLADGVAANNKDAVGFLINDASGYYLENIPAVASGKVAVTHGPCVVITDQIDTALTFAVGDKLYCGTGAKIGLVTNVPGAGAKIIGIAQSAASAASPNLQILVGA